MKNPDPGYRLPPGDAYTDDFACQLVYIPRNDFYYRAFLGALFYFSTWVAWERDDEKRGKDAAQAWREANELTMECWRMTNCLDDITDRMDEIIDLIALRKDCCDDNITYSPQVVVETDIEPDVGDPPEFYGETAVADWADWAEHVCHNAHIYVDILKHKAAEMDAATVNAAWTIGFIAAGLAALSFVGIGLAIVYGLAALTAGGMLAQAVEGVFTDTESDFETARNDIVCALLQGTSLAEAVEDALSSGLDWDLFFQFIDYESATAILYEGGYEQEYLPPDIRDDCECDLPPGYSWVDAEVIDFTLNPDTFGRINSAVVTLPNIRIGTKVATSASWGCATYPAGVNPLSLTNETYQTLAIRYTVVENTADKLPFYHGDCRDDTPGYRLAVYYTFDEAEGIDAAWADTQSDIWIKENMGHAKRAIGYEWVVGGTTVVDSTPGQTPVYFEVKLEHLVWVE